MEMQPYGIDKTILLTIGNEQPLRPHPYIPHSEIVFAVRRRKKRSSAAFPFAQFQCWRTILESVFVCRYASQQSPDNTNISSHVKAFNKYNQLTETNPQQLTQAELTLRNRGWHTHTKPDEPNSWKTEGGTRTCTYTQHTYTHTHCRCGT